MAPGTRGFTLTRRRFLSVAATVGIIGPATTAQYAMARPLTPFRVLEPVPKVLEPVPDVIEQVIPKAGMPAGITFKDSIQQLIAAGVIDPDKYRASAKELPAWVERLFHASSDDPVVFTEATAPYLIDLLWAIGLSNRAAFNENSPINTLSIPSYASTGGWTFGRQQNGYVYFNKVRVVSLTPEQQKMVLKVAKTTYRPCCNNSTFYQDCNHGSALLGLLELAASQGATLEGLYRCALTANSYWFPDNYAKTAFYFSHFYREAWLDIEPRIILSADYSSLSGWESNVNSRLRRANVTLPGISNEQQGC